MIIEFAIWAPSEAVFRQSWIDAGILLDQPGYVFSPNYPGIEITATEGWSGVVTKPTGNMITDLFGNQVPEMKTVPGWHCNARVVGPVAEAMTAGLPQTDADGKLLNVFLRTRAVQVFNLIQQPADTTTGFPAGYRNALGVTFADMSDIVNPQNVRQ